MNKIYSCRANWVCANGYLTITGTGNDNNCQNVQSVSNQIRPNYLQIIPIFIKMRIGINFVLHLTRWIYL